MIWLLIGYMWLFIHRPFEIWPVLGTLRIERVYMLTVIVIWLCSGPKGLLPNRLNWAFGFFAVVLVAAWLLSPYQELGTGVVEGYFKVGVFFVLLVTTVRDERQLRTIIIAWNGRIMCHCFAEAVFFTKVIRAALLPRSSGTRRSVRAGVATQSVATRVMRGG